MNCREAAVLHNRSMRQYYDAALDTRAVEQARDCLAIFLNMGNACDAPWVWRGLLGGMLRECRVKVDLAELLRAEERSWWATLPPLIEVYRGCEKGRVRGLHWTTDRTVAEGFAHGKRCYNRHPTLVRAVIPKPHVFALFLDRQEHEIVLDPRRLRQLRAEPLTTVEGRPV
jgi:hypothetical protein